MPDDGFEVDGVWYESLDEESSARVDAAVGKLEADGPALGRPFADTISASRTGHLKELRPLGGNLRVLFKFDVRRTAILLLGGDKTGDWVGWYERSIPIADELYETYITELIKEGVIEPPRGSTKAHRNRT